MYETLVLSGGALRGFALLGALQALYDQSKLNSIQKYIGTSIGAIIAYLLCIGYTPIEILVYLCKERCIEQIETMDIIRGFSGKGLLPFSTVRNILEIMTLEKIKFIPTLEELFQLSGKLFICSTYNSTKSQHEFLDVHSHPSLSCLDALQMSSSLPLLFEPFFYQDQIYMDGALICNFPLFHTPFSDPKVIGIRFKKTVPFFDSSSQNILTLCYQLLNIPTNYIDQLLNDPLISNCSIIEIDVSHCDHSLNFQLTNIHRLDMFSTGYEAVLNYFTEITK